MYNVYTYRSHTTPTYIINGCIINNRGVSGWWAIAHPVFGRIESAARRRATLILVHPFLGSRLRPRDSLQVSFSQKQLSI